MSGNGMKATERRVLTDWSRQGGVTCQDTEGKRPSEGNSLSREGREGLLRTRKSMRPSEEDPPTPDDRGRDFSGHGIKQTELGALTA